MVRKNSAKFSPHRAKSTPCLQTPATNEITSLICVKDPISGFRDGQATKRCAAAKRKLGDDDDDDDDDPDDQSGKRKKDVDPDYRPSKKQLKKADKRGDK